MPRLIFKCPYIKGGTSSATAHLENYVKYMATRNGVERIDPGRSEWPATSKQKKMVEQILRDFPLSRGMFEYEDYAAEPTRTNASEFITRALEDNYNLANRFVGELMEQLVQDGLLVTTKTRNGPGVRTATDAEISSPLPGQQQMTL